MTVEKNKAREPRILIFACKWCGLIGADGAGRNKVSLPLNFRVIPVECAAFVEPDAVIRALASGIDGVVVMGCHVGGCRFNNANHAAIKRLELLGDLLDATGVGRDRLMVSFGTAHEDHQFADVIRKYVDRIAQLTTLEPWVTPRAKKY
ncbi:MAG: hydrogenase iron-sulfur subunit [Deltaproteobacteria bacterium]|nr:hydrogenase iron-sulfur subunit [Deltaproteobacteria bacterium]